MALVGLSFMVAPSLRAAALGREIGAQARSTPVSQEEAVEAKALGECLAALSATVRRDEAQRLAKVAYASSRRLAREYRSAGPPLFHNFLVNVGVKERGLCHEWARDLGNELAGLELRTLVLRWGIARAGTLREHNCVVVTARSQSFRKGIVLDSWRRSGRLFWTRVAEDRYPWREDVNDTFRPGIRRAQSARIN